MTLAEKGHNPFSFSFYKVGKILKSKRLGINLGTIVIHPIERHEN